MKVLIINGSPKGKKSNTYRLTEAFVEGMKAGACEDAVEVSEIQVNKLDLKPCRGCFNCWKETPGICLIQDDMRDVLDKILWADMTIWSFPLYYYTVPGELKILIDRQLPLVLPFMTERIDQVGNGSHPFRYDMSGKKTVVISTCGFYTAEGNYDGVISLFDHVCGKGQYTTIFCGQGELFNVPELLGQTNEYLGYVKKAGSEYVAGAISPLTRARLSELLYPKEVFEQMADASWGISKESGEKESEALIFTRQMAALYRRGSLRGKEIVLEMNYTDLNERYQIVLNENGSSVVTGNLRKATTGIETPFTVWKKIAAGKIRGDEALMKHLYRVEGDFDLMLNWDKYFGCSYKSGDVPEKIHIPYKPTNMMLMMLPWIVFWVAACINSFWGSLLSICVCILLPLLFYAHKKTIYDFLSGVLVTGFSVALICGGDIYFIIPLAYFAFGVMWTLSCFAEIPLTAHYSMNQYNGEESLKNPLFIRTNRILTLLWGVLYLITPLWTYLIMRTDVSYLTGAFNSVLPVFMGIFTAWFQKWYPAAAARK